jgi:hypothetical protein
MAPIHTQHHVDDGEDKEPAHPGSKGSVEHVDDTMVELRETYVKPGILHPSPSRKNAAIGGEN